MPRRHEMRLNRVYFDRIVTGAKTIEVRVWDEKRRRVAAGEPIVSRS